MAANDCDARFGFNSPGLRLDGGDSDYAPREEEAT